VNEAYDGIESSIEGCKAIVGYVEEAKNFMRWHVRASA